MRTTFYALAMAVALVAGLVLLAGTAYGTDDTTIYYEDGTCQDEAGNPGLWSYAPPCYTAELYDEVFSFDNLADVIPAEALKRIDPTVAASDRLVGVGLVETPRTFKQIIGAVWPS